MSPVRSSTLISKPISLIGVRKLRFISAAKAFRGDTYSVCIPCRGVSARDAKLGRNPAIVLPLPVGAISSAVEAFWCAIIFN